MSKPATKNQVFLVAFFLAMVIILCSNSVALELSGEERTPQALMQYAWPPLIFMGIFGIAFMLEED